MCVAGGSKPVNSDSSLFLNDQNSDSLGAGLLSIALIVPDEDYRRAAVRVISACQSGEIREFASYPSSIDEVPSLLEQQYDSIIIELDSDPEHALELVENICAKGTTTVMLLSAKADSDLLVRCLRAGAREFLSMPLVESTVAEALLRASARRSPTSRLPKKASGRMLAFLGAKGGDGVTTLACNFAVSLAQESGQSTLLIDLDLPLGDAALNLGVVAEYSTINALQDASRLDSNLLSKLLVKHSSGVSVLAAPGRFPQFDASNEAIDKLLTVARQDFENVVIDMGSRLDLTETGIFRDGSTVYLVIQSHIAGLRNANRLISQYFTTDVPKLEIVLNRHQPRSLGVADDQITRALNRPPQWKIPNDYAAVRRMQHTAIPLALEDSPVSRLIRQMARSACGMPPVLEKSSGFSLNSGFSLKKIGRSFSSKVSTPEEAPPLTQWGLSSSLESATVPPTASHLEAQAGSSVRSTDPSPAEKVPVAEAQPLLTAGDAASPAGTSKTPDSTTTPIQHTEPETRVYQGATYMRGEDGRWHLQVPQATETELEEPEPETPAIEWPAPEPIIYGTALSAFQLNATASVPGTFDYIPEADEVLAAGTHELSAVFTPAETARYATSESIVSLTVIQATPVIAWPAPDPLAYGTALSAAQLNATASVPGTFIYTPSAGEVLPAGDHRLSVTFTPKDGKNYQKAQANISLAVTKATPIVMWSAPAAIPSGTALSAAQLNATALIPGTLIYTPGADEVLPAGTHSLLVTFIPADTLDYTAVQVTVPLTVTRAAAAVVWPALDAKPVGNEPSTAEFKVESQSLPAQDAAPRPATKPVLQPTPESVKAAAKAPFKPSAKVAAKSPMQAPGEAQVRIAEEPLVKATAIAHVKLPAKHTPEAPAEPPADTAANALVKFGDDNGSIDVGPGLNLIGSTVFEDGTTIYLVMKPGSAGVAESNRLVSQFFAAGGPRPDFEMNRFAPGATDDSKDPSSTALARLARTPIVRRFAQLVRSAPKLLAAPDGPEEKNGFNLKSIGRNIWARISPSEKLSPMTRLGLGADPNDARTESGAAQPDAAAYIAEKPFYALPVATRSTPLDQMNFASGETAANADRTDAYRLWRQAASAPTLQKPETRTYMGATYVKGEDGQWHLQQADSEVAQFETAVVPTPIAPANATSLNAETWPGLDDAVPVSAKRPDRKATPAPKKTLAKASTKRPGKPAAKPAEKTAARGAVKAVAKPQAKVSAKEAVKPVAMPAAKAPAKNLAKLAAKPVTKAPAKLEVKATAKPQPEAPASKPALEKKKSAPALSSKPEKRVATTKLLVNRPTPELETKELSRIPIVTETVTEHVN
jgi:pilus assembly protein CpaE